MLLREKIKIKTGEPIQLSSFSCHEKVFSFDEGLGVVEEVHYSNMFEHQELDPIRLKIFEKHFS